MSFSAHASSLFRHRGLVLGGLALLALLLAQPSPASFGMGTCMLLCAVSLRSWAFLYLGPSGRTRDPTCPSSRVVGGPYRWFAHPVYASNMLIAVALLVASSPGVGVAMALIGPVAALYLLLSARESEQLLRVAVQRRERLLSARELARSERSTWLQLLSFMAALSLML